MNIDVLRIALLAIPAGQHGAVSVRGTPIEVLAFNWEIRGDDAPFLIITKDDDSFCIVEIKNIDFFYTFPIPKPGKKR